MSERSDAPVWAGLASRLSGVEALIPDAPPWRPSMAATSRGEVRLGPSLRRATELRPRRSPLVLVIVLIALLLSLITGALLAGRLPWEPSRDDEPFGPFGVLRQSDGDARAALLTDGRAIIVSGEWQGIGNARGRADIWDPVAGFASIDAPTIARVNPTTTLLLDGRVLVIGGYGGQFAYPSSAIASAEVWDPGTSAFQQTGSMASARVGHTATLLPDGRVFVVGGAGPDGGVAEAELWDPRTNVFTPAGTLRNPRMGHAAALLLDGRVLVAGGAEPSEGVGIMEVEVWDPIAQSFTAEIALLDSPTSMSLTRLPSGSVLMAGAWISPGGYRGVSIRDPVGGPGRSLEMTRARDGHTATLLADGRVMVAGGRSPTGEVLDSVELWDPVGGLFHETTPLSQPAADHTAVLLADGRVLIVLDGSGPDGLVEPFTYEPRPMP